jgi:hypothetical protein
MCCGEALIYSGYSQNSDLREQQLESSATSAQRKLFRTDCQPTVPACRSGDEAMVQQTLLDPALAIKESWNDLRKRNSGFPENKLSG